MMRRVVITGMGIWSCIGQDLQTVTESLKRGRSGIIFDPKRIEYGLQSGLVGNVPRPDLKPLLPRQFRATMSEEAEYAYMAARQAFEQSGITDEYLQNNEVGIIFGSDYVTQAKIDSARVMRKEQSSQMLDPNSLFQSETSSVTMNLSSIFHVRGINLCVGAACASSSHAIGLATTFIRCGMQSMILVGGANETICYGEALLDSIEGISVRNEEPELASRPYDVDRDGHVPSGGAAALVLEEYEHAVARGATIFAEIKGYGFTADGTDILERDINRIVCAINRAIFDANISIKDIDYVHPFASSNYTNDLWDAMALNELFADSETWISSTESMTGHEHDMSGASHCVYSILMMQNGFIAPTINLVKVIPEASHLRIPRESIYQPIKTVLISSSGLGATNSAIILTKP